MPNYNEILKNPDESDAKYYMTVFYAFRSILRADKFPDAFIEDVAQDLACYTWKHLKKFTSAIIGPYNYLLQHYHKNRKYFLHKYIKPDQPDFDAIEDHEIVSEYSERFLMSLLTDSIILDDAKRFIMCYRYPKWVAGAADVQSEAISNLEDILNGNDTKTSQPARILARRAIFRAIGYRHPIELELRG
jgi:hypothetical protein